MEYNLNDLEKIAKSTDPPAWAKLPKEGKIAKEVLLLLWGTKNGRGKHIFNPNPALISISLRKDHWVIKFKFSQEKESLYVPKLPNNNKLDPRAWITKHLTADSLSDMLFFFFFWYTKRGRTPVKLISKPAQIPNQWEEEIENKDPKIATMKNI